MCAKFQGLLKTSHLDFCAENICILFSCLKLLVFSVGSSFCIMFHLIVNIGRSGLRMFA